ncbi:MAG TPA: MBL fold metallo-hydrolase [Longilinea sp.]|nr:MBL fold metallo-hydrolase [Longilinea sp.]
MGQITILGSAYALSGLHMENTYLAVQEGERTVLVDCVGNPIVRLQQAGIDPLQITEMILTHFHPDHVSGVPLLLMGLWLMGRKTRLKIYGLKETIRRTNAMMDLYEWQRWPEFFPVEFHSFSEKEAILLFDTPEMKVTGSPVKHLVPTLGLRFDFKSSGKSAAYSCDTEPCPEVIRLAEGADVLLHEASGESKGHTSPQQAGEVASKAGVKRLFLIHYPPEERREAMLEEAQSTFSGPVEVARDLAEIIVE